MTTSVGICVLKIEPLFLARKMLNRVGLYFFVILTTMSNTFTYFVDRSVLIFFGFSSLKIDCWPTTRDTC